MNRADFQQLAELRLREAQALLAAGLPDGAYYLAGYSVECALKACISKRTQLHDFPDKKLVNDSHTHNLKELLRLASWTLC
jgi:HEPN domain-containing protein